jgi:hypothetical protein
VLKRIVLGFRIVISTTVVAAVAYAGWQVWRAFDERANALTRLEELRQRVDDQDRQLAEQRREIERLETALRLLKVDHRVARLEVLDQKPGPSGALVTTLRFVELGPDGEPLGSGQTFRIDGDVVYVDAMVVQFQDQYVEQGDELRGTSLCLFRRVFGEAQRPNEGFPIDAVGVRPAAYSRGDSMSEFQQQLWSRFWDYANDAEAAAKLGVRALGGDAPSIRSSCAPPAA